MQKSNKIIQSLWVGDSLSKMEIMCINSYISNGHDFHLYTYNDIGNVPANTTLRDANSIIPQEQLFVDSFGGYVNLSNLFRYKLLYLYGGWWVDMDTVCLKPFNFDDDYVFSSELSTKHNRCLVNTTFIKSPARSEFLKNCINFIENRGYEYLHWGELGVNLISRMIFRNRLESFVKPYFIFCPISPNNIDLLISSTNYVLPENAHAIHWYNEIWKRMNLNKDSQFPPGSIYSDLTKRY